jgi:DNA-binding NarL/FixJ family response regulator
MICDRLATDDVQIIGEARDGDEAVARALELAPDIVVMDLLMPGCDGIAATRRIATEAPAIRVIILSVSTDPEAIMLALRSGAIGFLDKGIEMDALLRTVRGVSRGEAALDRFATLALIQEYRAASGRTEGRGIRGSQSAGSMLSAREQEILELLAEDHSTEAISEELHLAVETVRTHVKASLRKLRVHSRGEAIAVARSQGILTPLARSVGGLSPSYGRSGDTPQGR